jgi:putative ABC transport system permease protein
MAVVERRSHIGVLRAIGFPRWLVALVFVLESSVTAALGILLGGVAGLLVAAQVTEALARGRPEIQFVIPWSDLGMMAALAGSSALLMALLPARQAGAVRPAEALDR